MVARRLAMGVETVLAVLVVVGFLACGTAFPIPGVFLSLLSPMPFVLLRLRHGFPTLLLALGLTCLAVAGLSSPEEAVIFLLEFGLPALLLAEGLQRGSRPELTVTFVAVLLTLGGLAALVVAADAWKQPVSAVSQHVERLLADMEALTARLGLSADGTVPFYGTIWTFFGLPISLPRQPPNRGICFRASMH